MQTAENQKRSPKLGDQLSEALALLEAARAQDALAIVKQAKAAQPSNVFVLAFEKQVEQLIQLADSNMLTEEQKTDIMDSIPGIIDRAVEGAAVDQLSAERGQKTTQASRDDKAAALEWLKDQYFQHAHEYVQQGRYDHALAEIRRVYIIDAGNKTALEFERRIEHLAGLKSPPPVAPPPPTLRLLTKESLKDAELQEPSAVQPPPPAEPPPVEQPVAEVHPPPPVVHDEAPVTAAPRRTRLRPAAIVLILLVVIAAGASAYLLWMRSWTDKRAAIRRSTAVATPQTESFIGPETTADERTFVISSGEESGGKTPQVEEEAPPPVKQPPAKPARTPKKESRPTRASTQPMTEAVKPAPKTEIPVTETKQPITTSQPGESAASQPQVVENPPASPSVLEKSAEVIKLEQPRFPDASAVESLEGQVVIQVQVDASGKPLATRVLQSSNPILIQPITTAVMKSKFSPAQMSSGPVTSWLTIPFKFKKK